MFARLHAAFRRLMAVPEDVSPVRYASLRRSMTLLMVAVSVTPLLVLTGINHASYQSTIRQELATPLRGVAGKTRTSLELFLTERASTVSLIASAYSFEELSDEKTLTRIFRALKQEFQGFVDLGLVNSQGIQTGYVGPYNLKGVDYREQPWLHQAEVQGKYISDVFLGVRGTPHLVIAVSRMDDTGRAWVVRATIDTAPLEKLVSATGLSPDADAFLLNTAGVLQTSSRLYGDILAAAPLAVPPVSHDTTVIMSQDKAGRDLVAAYAFVQDTDFVVMAVKPRTALFQPWTNLQTDLLMVLCVGIALIVGVSSLLIHKLVGRLQASDEHRIAAMAQIEHSHKLSSIGRLAAGVAHEVNNPLAVINEKAGLALDFLRMMDDFPKKDRITTLLEGITVTVERARGITHRLLGFARRMDADLQELHVDEVLAETLGFLEQEARQRGVTISTDFHQDVPAVVSDRGQLQQVFLNIVGNALAAVEQGGAVNVACLPEKGGARVVVRDNGKGIPPEVMRHLFEPFFTTKQEQGNGLGMFITYGIVKRLGGSIAVDSTPGAGATVTVILPPVPPENPEKAEEGAA